MKRSKFSLSNYKLLTCDQGQLVPVGLTEVLPGDTIQQSSSFLVRLSPLLAPVMHPVHITCHHWFVPHRLVWRDWESFITGGANGDDQSVFPYIKFPNGGPEIKTLADYFGIPTDIVNVNGTEVSALPFRAYALIFNEWYRDQDLVSELVMDNTDGEDTTTSVALQNVAWQKDYFTSARPWAQKGPEVTLPLGTTAPVIGISKKNRTFTLSSQAGYETDSGASTVNYANAEQIKADSDDNTFYIKGNGATSANPQIFADLSNATAIDVNTVRRAFALQRFQELRLRYGSRYTEYLRAAFGVKSSDARLQRPEYLGGGKQTIQFSEVLATAETGSSVDVGDMKGHGIGVMRTNRYRRFFEEHGYIITVMNVKPITMYTQGLPRTWNRRTKEDFFQKELQHIGQQEVLYKELYASHTTPDGTFGYQDRYDEYRRTENTIAGEFRNSTYNYWHMARVFSADPELNSAFITSNPTNRIYASTTNNQLLIMAKNSIQARRLVAPSGTSFIL